MKIKHIIFTLFLFVLAFGSFHLTPSFNLSNVGIAHAESGSSGDSDYDDDSRRRSEDNSDDDDSDDEEDRIRTRYEEKTKYDKTQGIPIRQEVRERLRIEPSFGKVDIENRDRTRVRDFDGNDSIGWSDLRIMLTNWGRCGFAQKATDVASMTRRCSGDTNEDGVVDILDLEEILTSWNENEDGKSVFEIIDNCREETGAEEQRSCLLRSLQEKEIRIKTDRARVTWEERGGEKDKDNSGKSVEARVENYLKYMSNMATRMYAAVERLRVLSQRIDSRITKLEETGLDMTNSKDLLLSSQEKIEVIKTQISELSRVYESAIESEDPKKLFERIRSDVQGIKDALKDIHLSLIEIVKSIRLEAGEKEDEVESSNSDSPAITN